MFKRAHNVSLNIVHQSTLINILISFSQFTKRHETYTIIKSTFNLAVLTCMNEKINNHDVLILTSFLSLQNTVDKLVQRANASILIGTSSWKEQFREALTVSAGKLI